MSEAKTIKEQIGFLIELQVVDGEIYALKKEKIELPEQVKMIEAILESKKARIKQTEGTLKNLQVKLKDKEVELQQKEEKIKKLESQLYQLKTNKEYTAMLTEIAGIKADNSLIEEEIIRLMDEIDAGKKNLTEEKGLFKAEEIKAQKDKDEVNARLKKIDARVLELDSNRQKIVPNIEAQILSRYEKVLKNKDGLAMVPVEDGACGGCHMNLPPQVINEVKLKEDIVVCNSCLRLLYL